MSKYYALKGKDKFDISKITVVGSPTITSDGVASGFSSGNYVSTNIDLSNKTFIIECPEFTYLEDTTQTQYVLNYGSWDNGMYVVVNLYEDGIINCTITNSTAHVIRDYSIKAINGNKYQVKFVLDDKKAEIYLKANGAEYVLLKSVANSQLYTVNNTTMYIGTESATLKRVCKGSIDLKEFKIYVDNELVYSPTIPTCLFERRKEGYDPSKFTVEGSPTITDGGIASGFSASDYIKFPDININGKDFEIQLQIHTPDTIYTTAGGIVDMYTRTAPFKLAFSGSGNRLYLSSSTGTNTPLFPTFFTSGLDVNTLYYVKCGIKSNKTYISYSTNGTTWVDYSKAITGNSYGTFTDCTIGLIKDNKYVLTKGSVVLPSFSITVDGKEVFTGAKEVFYALRM